MFSPYQTNYISEFVLDFPTSAFIANIATFVFVLRKNSNSCLFLF